LEILACGWFKLDWFQIIVKGAGLEVKDDNGQFKDDADKALSKATKSGHEAVVKCALGYSDSSMQRDT
jgi:hypothetical protein